ncbi:cysteine-rich DPF motif domain-containing protein 1 [Cephus cinctus]|uniref:Cysteine-rich DPF motif domain-containing protein 1 n=1 Tax=Cephus cinctus TaxID=211228 RepID=A0AAJ7FGV4_CEPCN|nr:cysteine-rich DPF motif domain-containing protein 1 [Cephus cinctus]
MRRVHLPKISSRRLVDISVYTGMDKEASTSQDTRGGSKNQNSSSTTVADDKKDPGGTFKCFFCHLNEHFDYKGSQPPFSKQICYSENCYIMKDPFSLPNRGEVLVLGGDCSVCNKSVCLGCSIFYTKRFCKECAFNNVKQFPLQLHNKITSLAQSENI